MNRSLYLLSVLAFTFSCRSEKSTDGLDSAEPVVEDSGSTAANDTGGSESLEVSREGMLGHLNALMTIATDNGGNRAAGTPGYTASVVYVTAQLEAAGYSVQIGDFDIERDVWNSEPIVSTEGEESWEYGEDFAPMSETGTGEVTAQISGVDLMIPPPDESGGVTSGCEASDFDAFTAGHVALIQRGACTFQNKVSNAVSAGAVAVLIFNEGQPGRRDLFGGTLDADVENTVPVFSLSYAVGEVLASLDEGAEVTISADFERVTTPTQNIFADTSGDPERVVVVGAHLDSVEAGPGINDNGSGVAMVLEMAVELARQGFAPDNQVRFAFWGGEELGLLGSMNYIFDMSEDEHSKILANLNFDMVASPNPARMVYDGDGSAFGDPGPSGSSDIERIFSSWFEANGQAYRETPFDGRSDYGPFIWTGIPAGGLFTGAEQVKTPAETEAFGGVAGTAYDECYHQNCDTIENLDLDVLDEMAAAALESVNQLSAFEGSMGSDGPLSAPHRVSRAHALPDWIPSACGAHERTWRR